LLACGLTVAAAIVWHVGFGVVVHLVLRVGWAFPLIVAILALHIAVRAAGLWRVMLDGVVRYPEVLRIRFAAEAVEILTFTGPFLAEPAKGWLLTRRGVATSTAYAAVVTEYLLYTAVSAMVAMAALVLLLTRYTLPAGAHAAAVLVVIVMLVFVAAFAFASVTGIGLIVPILRASRVVIGRRALGAAERFARVEDLIVTFLHRHRVRLAEVLAIELAANALWVVDTWITFAALGFPRSWSDSLMVEGSGKFVAIAFAFIPGQLGASEGVNALLAASIGLPAAAGVSLALVRRLRSLVVAVAGLAPLTRARDR
jgi:Lysylphosphatidylglycerol synthase TM region